MAVKTKQKKEPSSSTQRYLPFSWIKENIIIMKDNSVRIILKCSSINFLLKNNDEQDSIIISFQRFLNSIDFPIQIIVRSKKLDIDSYLNNLNSKALKQENALLQNQTYEYIAYLKKLIEVAQIMKKEFYIIGDRKLYSGLGCEVITKVNNIITEYGNKHPELIDEKTDW